MNSRILGFDFGLRRIGLAVGNSITRTSQALSTLPAKNGQPDPYKLHKILQQWKPGLLVVGLPLTMDGMENAMSIAAKKFGKNLSAQSGIPVHFVDERLSTVSADNLLRESIAPGKKMTRKHRVARDNLAAQLILQTCFNDYQTMHNAI